MFVAVDVPRVLPIAQMAGPAKFTETIDALVSKTVQIVAATVAQEALREAAVQIRTLSPPMHQQTNVLTSASAELADKAAIQTADRQTLSHGRLGWQQRTLVQVAILSFSRPPKTHLVAPVPTHHPSHCLIFFSLSGLM